MEERNLERDYKLYIKKFVREYRCISHELENVINKTLVAIRDRDILEELKKQQSNSDLDLNDNITELERNYKLYIKKFVREYRLFGTRNQKLLDAINEILVAIKNINISEEIIKQQLNSGLDLNDNITDYTRLKSTKIEF